MIYSVSEASLYILGTILNENLLYGIVSRYEVGTAFLEGPIAYTTKTSISSHFKQFLSHTCYLIPSLMLTLFLPVRMGHLLFPFTNRLQFSLPFKTFDHDTPTYIENMLFHVLVPIIFDKFRYAGKLKMVLKFFFENVCQALDLNDCLKNNPPSGISKYIAHAFLFFSLVYFYSCSYTCEVFPRSVTVILFVLKFFT